MNVSAIWAVVPAAGIGERMGASLPKQYLPLAGIALLQRTIDSLLAVERVERVVVALAENDSHWASLHCSHHEKVTSVIGGASRASSVMAGVEYVVGHAPEHCYVLVHDAARALTSAQDIKNLIDTVFASENPAAGGLLAVPVQDTLKLENTAKLIEKTVDRNKLWQAQTPQFFPATALLSALSAGKSCVAGSSDINSAITDEASAMELQGVKPLLVESLHVNFKITRAQDLQLAEAWLNYTNSTDPTA